MDLLGHQYLLFFHFSACYVATHILKSHFKWRCLNYSIINSYPSFIGNVSFINFFFFFQFCFSSISHFHGLKMLEWICFLKLWLCCHVFDTVIPFLLMILRFWFTLVKGILNGILNLKSMCPSKFSQPAVLALLA